ncbi:HU family DNA-binding protein [Alicyclobacillus cycloheptanicus]|uniref:DNA-binding protein HU-beta n=1 Tax=Alicyclobacillus cycloheptanicus TaxID=1457 RepID=A0ABT9XF87_9BACL|nr:HU family DNA-binding protein [Alicyclobacillus cycloheptanicus]MDQ0188493.1 DNA-binding protein HU-beta [Alicyclobacillus cycloheptanicus]WDM01182.1 HU family DNA-binding protein [Alicyclobacillus cycloheptanicus]
MNKTELVQAVSERTELSRKDASEVVEAVFEVITEALANGEKVQLVGFGNFEIRERAARKGRNPQTGEVIDIAASRVPAFRAGKTLREGIR